MEPYISSEESTMAGEEDGEVHKVNGAWPRTGGSKGGNRWGRGGRGRGRGRGRCRGDPKPFGFPILDEDITTIMKNISPPILPNLHGLRSEDPKTFLFVFEVLCRSYDYLLHSWKLKLFPATFEDTTLKWFMGLGVPSIRTWEEMKTTLLEKYKDYCIPHNLKDKVFKMM